MTVTDEALVEQSQTAPLGDTRAFDELTRRHQERVLANCRHLTASPDDAQDLAQGVFVKAYFGLRKFQGKAAFGTWITRIKINHCLNFLRSRKDRQFVEIDDPAVHAEPELQVAAQASAGLEQEERRARIRATLDALPETLRVPLVMRDMDGLSYGEIAEKLNVGLSAVKMRIKRAREAFREAMGES